jgi:hypothetical protein
MCDCVAVAPPPSSIHHRMGTFIRHGFAVASGMHMMACAAAVAACVASVLVSHYYYY